MFPDASRAPGQDSDSQIDRAVPMEDAHREELVAFGRRVQAARVSAGLTQQQLADAVGAHRVEISKIETGDREPGVLRFARIVRALDLAPDDLFPRIEGPLSRE